ncbi:MAG: HIT domain-containing protein [Candidatus Dojkabacteria bacterium]
MDDCIFCKIGAGVIPAHKIHEDENYLAFLDRNPNSDGHTLVIPKKHYRFVWDIEEGGKYFEFCQKVAKHFQEVTKDELVFSVIHGEAVPHAHIHLIPNNHGTYGEKLSEFAKSVSGSPLTDEKVSEIVNLLKF